MRLVYNNISVCQLHAESGFVSAIVIVQLYYSIIIMLHRYTWLEADDWDTILSKDFPICFNSEVNQTLWMEKFIHTPV